MNSYRIARSIGIWLLGWMMTMPVFAADEPVFTEVEKVEIEQLIRNYILENPEIIPEAVQILQQRDRQRRQAEAKAMIAQRRGDLDNDGISPVLGNPDGSVTLIEFYDYQCAYCRWSYNNAVAELLEKKGHAVRYVFKQFPVLDAPGEPRVSYTAAKAALAAEIQGKFKPFHEAMMTRDGGLDIERVFKIASKAGLDVDKLRSDMENPLIAQSIQENLELGRAIGITGTPAYIIGGDLMPGAQDFESLASKVEAVDAKDAAGG